MIFINFYAFHATFSQVFILHDFDVNFRLGVFDLLKKVEQLESNF